MTKDKLLGELRQFLHLDDTTAPLWDAITEAADDAERFAALVSDDKGALDGLRAAADRMIEARNQEPPK